MTTINMQDNRQAELLRWSIVRGHLRLQAVGMKSRAGAIRPRIAAELGLRPRDSYELFLDRVQARIDELRTAPLFLEDK